MIEQSKTPVYTLDQVRAAVGTEVGRSPWRTVTQEMIDQFAEATDDHQWLHTDPKRAAEEAPFGGTIAHGFLTLSLLSTLAYDALPTVENQQMGMNYGFDKVRFTSVVKAGARVRAVFILEEADIRRSGRILATYDVVIEVENTKTPALKAKWLTLAVVPPLEK